MDYILENDLIDKMNFIIMNNNYGFSYIPAEGYLFEENGDIYYHLTSLTVNDKDADILVTSLVNNNKYKNKMIAHPEHVLADIFSFKGNYGIVLIYDKSSKAEYNLNLALIEAFVKNTNIETPGEIDKLFAEAKNIFEKQSKELNTERPLPTF